MLPEAQELLNRFTNHLYARSGMRESSIQLMVGYIRRMFKELGTNPNEAELDAYITGLRKRKISYGHLANALKAIEHFTAFLGKSRLMVLGCSQDRPSRRFYVSLPRLFAAKRLFAAVARAG